MIYDNLSNISLYKGLSSEIFSGLTFLQQMQSDIEIGTHQITPQVKVIVSKYETMRENEYGFEAHKKFIDIQCNIKGIEKVGCLPIERLKETKSYGSEVDEASYTIDEQSTKMIIGNGYFAISLYGANVCRSQVCRSK